MVDEVRRDTSPRFAGSGRDPLGERLNPGLLGFHGNEETAWTKEAGKGLFGFRPLRRLAELVPLEQLQRDVFGVDERDVIPASELVVVAETGGEVIAAFAGCKPDDELVGALVGWGGFVAGVPRIVSDLLAVRPGYRGRGIGADLKKLQAALAADRGFREIVWTVDPLRAANARLNVAKLGATAHRYERNRYGDGFGAGLYGRMPTDRLHMIWDIESERVRSLLLGTSPPAPTLPSPPPSSVGTEAPRAAVEIPVDIDALLRVDPETASDWRYRIRTELETAFAEGWQIDGFAAEDARAVYILSPRSIPPPELA